MFKTLATAAVVAAALATAAFAQGPGRGMRTPPDPQTMVATRVDRLATVLSLTDAQKAKATTIFTDAHTAVQSIQTSLQSSRQSLSDAIKKNDAAAIDSQAGAIGVLMGQLMAIQSKAEAAFYAILTPDQQAKYEVRPLGGPGRGMGPGMGPAEFGGQGRRGSRQ